MDFAVLIGTSLLCARLQKLDTSEPAVFRHMRILRECGMLYGKKKEYQVHYRIERERLARLFDGI